MIKRRNLPSNKRLHELFEYKSTSGLLLWKSRSIVSFADVRSAKNWNTKYADKPAGCFVEKEGIKITIDGKSYSAHRLIFKMFTGLEPSHIDHVNLNRKDNRFKNLRSANDMTNGWNVAGHKNTVSGLKNVYFHEGLNKPWKAAVNKARKSYSGGYHATKEAAFDSACSLRLKLHGEFARHGFQQKG